MIKINLAKRKSSGVAMSDGEPKLGKLGGLGGFDFKNIDLGQLEGLKDLPFKKLAGFAIVAILAQFWLDNYQEEELQKIEAAMKKVRADQVRLKGELEKTKGFEQIKKSLEGDELTIKTKIEVIQKLILDRQKPPKLLLSLSNLMPGDVWLNTLQMNAMDMKLEGRALGFIQISEFMKNLTESADFADVKLLTTETVTEESGIEVGRFSITAKRR